MPTLGLKPSRSNMVVPQLFLGIFFGLALQGARGVGALCGAGTGRVCASQVQSDEYLKTGMGSHGVLKGDYF